ncbi:MAG: ABC transporter ATP-binding protein/permease [Lactobacillaceae bacterium]|jgi:ATP-binding cassette subfamily B protein|nr:ABC transporter ATP-binding protein/permease [Lactobacillaceae bacterium]
MRNYAQGGRGGGPRFARPTEKAHDFWPTVIRLFKYMRRDKWGVVISIIIAAVSVILSVRAPKILGQATTIIFDGVLDAKKTHHIQIDMPAVEKVLLTVGIIYAISALFSVTQQWIMTKIAQRTVYQLRQEFKAKMTRLPIAYYDSHSNGDVMSRLVNDMDNISSTLNTAMIQILTSALTFVGVSYFMLTISWELALVAFISVPLSVGFVRLIAPKAQRYFMRQQTMLGLLNDQIEETFAGHTVVKTFNQEAPMIERFDKRNADYYKAAWKAQFVSTLVFPTMRFVNNLDYLAMAVIGGLKVATGSINLGDVQAMLQYTNQFSQPITQIANLSNTIQATVASAERIFEVLDADEMVDTTGMPDIQTADIISFDQVSFQYVPDQPLMADYSLSVEPGQMVALVGPTGAGKSTVINLLERFYDTNGGAIRFHGRDTRNLSRSELREHFAMVLQDTWLFTGTIRENIRYGKLDASDADVENAAKMAYADEFIHTLPEGYDTILNESASNISQGQRQLLTIARAFLADPEVLILDEATSSVDTRTEQQIQTAMGNLLNGRTSFVVAHRLSTIRNADQILVMQHGAIVENGTHDSLLASGGVYADLYNSQFASSL